MSQLPALPSLDEIVKQSRRAKADAAIALSREATPESATEQRTAKRLSIAELNDTDIAELRRRVMSGAPHDERPAWVKALDIIDLPRNALFNLAAPGIATRKARSGDRATFGMGRVNFSDVLEELGVDNRIVRGVGGFVGDVAFDPLTYIGPAGWGLKVGSGVGKGVSSVGFEVGKRGAKSLTGGIKAAARGEEVGEETVRNLLKIKGYDRDGVAALAAKGMTPDQIRQQITKDIIGADESGFGRFLRILGSDRDATGGSLAKGVFEPGASDALSAAGKAVGIEGVSQAEAKAAREFLTKFSKVNAPGIKIGKGGSQIAHFPFTEFGIQVPAFTSAARRNVALHGAMTRMLGLAPDAVTVGSGIEEAARAVEGLVRTVGDIHADDPATLTDEVAEALAQQAVAVREAVKSLQGPNKTPEEVFAAARLDEIAGLAQKNVEAVLKDMPNIGQRANLNKDIGQRVQRANREFRWLEKLSDDDGFDYLPKDPDGNRYAPSDPNVRFAAAEQLRSLRKALRGAKNLKNEKAVATIREKIKQTVVGPGGMEAIDLDAADAQVAELSKQQYAGAARRLVDMSDEDAAAYEVAIKSLTDSLAAARELADATGGSFTRHISDDARDLIELNRMVLGTNDDTIASSPLMSVRDAIKARYGDDGAVFRAVAAIEASMRKTFGTRGGVVKRATRFLERGLSEEAHNARAKSIARLSIAAKDTAEELGLGDQFKEFVEAVTAIAVRMRNDADDAYYVKSYVDDLGKEMDLAQAEAAGLKVHDSAFRQIDRFTKSGLITPERLPKMELLAKEFVDALEDLADADIHAGVLGEEARLPGYIPSAATPGARDAVRVARKNQFAPGRSGGAGDKLGQLEGFQKARTTDQVRWMGADGKMRRIFQSDLALADIPKAELSEREQKVREMVLEWQRLPNPPQWRRTDYAELNDLVASGRFQRLTAGANITEGFFESNMLSMLSSRSASSQLSRSRKAFTDMFSQSGLTIDAKDYDTILASPGGKPVTLAGGAEGRVGKMIGSQPTVWVNGQRWRKLSADVIDRDNPLYRLIGDENAGRIYHESMADAIERVAKVFGTDEDIKRWLQAYDQFQGIWKTITLSHPSWTVGDASGNVALQLQGGMRPQAIANFGKQAIAVAWHENNIDFLKGQRVKFGGREMSGEDFIKMLVELNVWGADQASEVAKQLKRMDLMGVAQSSDDFINPPSSLQTAKRAVTAPVNAVKGAVAGAKEGESIGGKVAGAAQGFGDEIMRSWIGPFFRVNRKVNNAQRAIMFMDLVDQGYDLPSAAAKVIEHMFDYADLTHTERHGLRRALPFYCVPDHSEILTRDGWKKRENLAVGEDVMTYNVTTDKMEFQPCLEVAAFDFDGELASFTTERGVRIDSTDNHRWAVSVQKNFVKGKWYGGDRKMVETRDLKKNHKIVMAAEWDGERESSLTPDQARLLGWLLTDGYFRWRGNCCEAVIYQSPKKFLDEVKLVAGGKPRAPHPDTGVVCVPVLRERIDPIKHLLVNGKSDPAIERIPLSLSREAIDAMHDAMYKAEGSMSFGKKGSTFKFFAQSEFQPILGCFRLLSALRGKRTNGTSRRGCYISDRRSMKVASMKIGRAPYFGKVWCPRTTNGTWVMRQNGVITITGNTWLRNNMAYQVQQLFTNPKFAASVPKVQEAVEQMLLGEERIPNHQRPGWMRDQLAIQFAKDPDSFVMARPLLPQTDAIQPLTLLFGTEGALDFAHYFGSGLTPVIKAATDLAYGQELFSGKPLGENADAGQVPLGEYALKQFRPARELGLVGGSSAIGAAKQGVVPFAGRLALGGKFQSQPEGDVDRRLKGQYKRKEQEFRTAISRSRKNGDADGENRGIIELLKLYRRMAEVGLADEIPKKYRPIVVGDTETATNG